LTNSGWWAFGNEPSLERSLKIYLCQKYTGEKLKTIGDRFGIPASAVSHSIRRFRVKIQRDRRVLKKIEKTEKRFELSKIKI